MDKQRIGYIDAMRGFTMILVVYSHVCSFCLGDSSIGYNNVFFLFRLPCFFFVSGWLFEQVAMRPFWQNVRKKFMVQIVPTVVFLLLLAPPPLFFSRLGATKGGYWFTFALFEFFVLYMLSVRIGRKWSALVAVAVSLLAFCYDVYYNRYFKDLGLLTDALGFLGFMTWRYYLFFYVGTWVKSHFDAFVRFTDRYSVIVMTAVGFIAIAMIPHSSDVWLEYLVFSVGGILGLTLVFTSFRKLYPLLPSKSKVHFLEFVGTRTLDIYLLHYFFLPRWLMAYADHLRCYGSKPLELAVGLLLACVIVGVCLVVSYIIRLSPFLAHYLFGANTSQGDRDPM